MRRHRASSAEREILNMDPLGQYFIDLLEAGNMLDLKRHETTNEWPIPLLRT
jgi:hypothetical protein